MRCSACARHVVATVSIGSAEEMCEGCVPSAEERGLLHDDVLSGEMEHVANLTRHPLRQGRFTRRTQAAALVFDLTPDDVGPEGLIIMSGAKVDTATLLLATQHVGYLPAAPEPWGLVIEATMPGLTFLNQKKAIKGGTAGGNAAVFKDVLKLVNERLQMGKWVASFAAPEGWEYGVRVFAKEPS